MSKSTWILAIPLVLVACQKSPGAYQGSEPEPYPEQGEGGTDGRETQPDASGPEGSEPGRPYEQGTDVNEPGQPYEQGTDGSELGQPYEGAPGIEPATPGTEPAMPGTDGEMGRAGTEGQPGQPGAPGTDGFGQPGRPELGADRAAVPPAINEFQQYVSQLRGASDMQYTDVSQALRQLAGAFRTLPDASPGIIDQVTKVESYADRIEAAGATSNMQARWAKRALTESADALEMYQKEQNLTGMDDRVQALRGQLDQINEDQPFAGQKDAFVNALSQLSDTLVHYSAPRRQPGTQ